MAETRRTYTPEDKQKILAHAAEHGQKIAAEHFNVATSMIHRWRKQAAPPAQRKKGQWRKKKWTGEKIAAVLEFNKTHSNTETTKHFKISSSQLSLWKRGMTYFKAKRKANGTPPMNGLGELPAKDALLWLERYYAAYLRQVKQEAPGPVTLYKILSRGGK